jgi:hypothetical protein
VRKDNELRSAGQESVELVESQAAIVLYVQYPYAGTRALCHQLPRNQTRVMLRYGKDHFVSGTEVSAPPGCGLEVDGFRRAARPHDFFRSSRIHKFCNLLPGLLIQRRASPGEGVEGWRGVRVLVQIEICQAVNNSTRPLRRRSTVQVNQGVSIDSLCQHRKLCTKRFRVQ